MYNICKVQGSNPAHHKKKNLLSTLVIIHLKIILIKINSAKLNSNKINSIRINYAKINSLLPNTRNVEEA